MSPSQSVRKAGTKTTAFYAVMCAKQHLALGTKIARRGRFAESVNSGNLSEELLASMRHLAGVMSRSR